MVHKRIDQMNIPFDMFDAQCLFQYAYEGPRCLPIHAHRRRDIIFILIRLHVPPQLDIPLESGNGAIDQPHGGPIVQVLDGAGNIHEDSTAVGEQKGVGLAIQDKGETPQQCQEEDRAEANVFEIPFLVPWNHRDHDAAKGVGAKRRVLRKEEEENDGDIELGNGTKGCAAAIGRCVQSCDCRKVQSPQQG